MTSYRRHTSAICRLLRFCLFVLLCVVPLINASARSNALNSTNSRRHDVDNNYSVQDFYNAVFSFQFEKISFLSEHVLIDTPFKEDANALCFLARTCQENEDNLRALKTAEELLKLGSNPNTACGDDFLNVFHSLILGRCSNLLQRLLNLRQVKHPIDVNRQASFDSNLYPPLILAGASLSPSSVDIDRADRFSTFRILLNTPNLDVNAEIVIASSSTSYPLIWGICRDVQMYISMGLQPGPLLEMLWSHPHLDLDQRYGVINLCGYDIDSVLSSSSPLYSPAKLYSAAVNLRFEHITPLSRNIESSSSQIVKVLSLCHIAMQCTISSWEQRGHTVKALLENGANPNAPCPSNQISNVTMVHILVLQQCPELLDQLLSMENVTHPADINAELQLADGSRLPPLLLTLDSDTFDSDDESLVLDVILKAPNLDINGLLPGNIPAVKHLCSLLGSASDDVPSFVLLKLLSHPHLDDEQRELLLNHCGNGSKLYVDYTAQPFWQLDVSKKHALGSEEFSRVYLEAISTASSADLRLPLKIVGGEGQDEGGVVASVLEHLTAAAFSFGDYEFSALSDLSENVRISESQFGVKHGETTQVFAPAPSSLLLFSEADNANIGVELKKRMKTVGILIGVCLNTLFFSQTLTLGVSLDRVVLQRLIDPSSTISTVDALDSAVCARASKLVHLSNSLSEAQHMFPGVWPEVASPPNSSQADYRKELDNYCIALVDRLLDVEESPAFQSMLDGFRSTIPVGQMSHYSFSAEFAHRMLTGYSSITMEMLRPRLRFQSIEDQDTSELDEIFVELLSELSMEDSENLSRFLRQVTGSSRLRKGSSSHSVIIQWLRPGTTNAEYIIATCASMLSIPRPREQKKNSLRAILDSIMSPSITDVFNSS